MALGAITKVSGLPDTKVGGLRMCTRDIVLGTGANYNTGGETISPSQVGMKFKILQVMQPSAVRATSGGATARTIAFDYATTPASVKMQVYTTASAEAAGNSDQSAYTARLTFLGQ
jgi:hypothetical protein